MSDTSSQDLLALTAEIVAAHVANNAVHPGEVASLISTVYAALSGLGSSPVELVAEKPKGAVSVRASIKPGHLVSMIDGKPYKMLRRHVSQHGYTPESYREAFGLAKDYPMVAADYAEQRRALAHKIGLGRKPQPVGAPVATKRGRKPKAATTLSE